MSRDSPPADTGRTAHRQAQPDPGRAGPRRSLDRLDRAHSPQAKGRVERVWGTLQDRLTSGTPTAPGRHDRRGQRSPRRLPAGPQPAVRRPGRDRGTGLAGVGRRSRRRVGLRLPLSTQGRPRRDDQLGRRGAGPASPAGWRELGRSGRHPRGASRQQPLGEPPGITLSARSGTPRATNAAGARPPPPVGRGARTTTTARGAHPTVTRTRQTSGHAPVAPLSCHPEMTGSLSP